MSLDQFKLDGRTAIVTGAGRGIGKAIALGLADAGANVAVAARTLSEIEQTVREIEKIGKKAAAIPTDVRFSDQVQQLVKKTTDTFGGLDILINNAGGMFTLSLLEMSENAWDAMLRENLKPVFLCSQAVAKEMKSRGKGVIVNIASIVGTHSQPLNAAYAASKAAIINLTQTMAEDWAKYNIRVNAIAPGHIDTSKLGPIYGNKKIRMNDIPLGRPGQPEDISGAAIYLASDASLYVTGQTMVIDGGATSKCSIGLE
jgi:NAD(P)-dependent dehydrogenase (short-subunit alcohol dehydrogenase family)